MKRLFTFMIALMSLFLWQSTKAADVVFNVTVPTPTNQVWMAGNFQGWNVAKMVQGVKVDDTHFKVTLKDSIFTSAFPLDSLQYKYASGNFDWAYVEKNAAGSDLAHNRKYSDSKGTDVVQRWGEVYDPANAKDVKVEVLTPLTTIECYITGNFNGWLSPSAEFKMDKGETTTDGIVFTKTIHVFDINKLEYKFASGPAWDYQQSSPSANFKYATDGITVVVTAFTAIFDPAKTGDIHITAMVPAGTQKVWIIGSFEGWDLTKAVEGTKNADGTFSFTIPLVINMEYKLYNKPDWANVEGDGKGKEVANRKASYPTDANTNVTVLEWLLPTGISQLEEATNLIYTHNSSIVVEGVTARVDVFDVTGRLLQSEKKVGTFISKSLKPGIYMVRVDRGIKKVALK